MPMGYRIANKKKAYLRFKQSFNNNIQIFLYRQYLQYYRSQCSKPQSILGKKVSLFHQFIRKMQLISLL